jgi:nucleoid-associated protein YgaU
MGASTPPESATGQAQATDPAHTQPSPSDPRQAQPSDSQTAGQTPSADPSAQQPGTQPDPSQQGMTQGAQSAQAGASGGSEYTVVEGDTLSEIAQRLTGSSANWQRIAQENGVEDPTKLRVGQTLRIPAEIAQRQ